MVYVKATIEGEEVWQTRMVSGEPELPRWPHFGLDDAEVMDSVVVQWPNGLRQEFADVGVDRLWTLREGGQLGVAPGDRTAELPRTLTLAPVYPNPFNASTTVRFALPRAMRVDVIVYDLLGREVTTLTDGYRTAGNHTLRFDGTGLASGIYFVRLSTSIGNRTQKMLLVQ
jgi:hypothetical protein